jgi:hypothetical protein
MLCTVLQRFVAHLDENGTLAEGNKFIQLQSGVVDPAKMKKKSKSLYYNFFEFFDLNIDFVANPNTV